MTPAAAPPAHTGKPAKAGKPARTVESSAIHKIAMRLVPFVALMFMPFGAANPMEREPRPECRGSCHEGRTPADECGSCPICAFTFTDLGILWLS
jgi:hypothetical protein